MPITPPSVNRFFKILSPSDSLINLQQISHLNIPPHIKYVATLPCEHECQKTGGNLTRIVINDKLQSSTVKHLSFDGLLQCKFITQFASERIFFNRWTFGEVTGKMVDCVMRPIRLRLLSSKMQNSPDNLSKTTGVLRTETVSNCCYDNSQINVSLL